MSRDYIYEEGVQKVALCVPTIGASPYPQFKAALAASQPVLDAMEGYKFAVFQEAGNPYISNARATMMRKALDWGAEIIIFIDHDISWEPEDLVKLIKHNSNVAAGTYRYKHDEEKYMGTLFTEDDGRPVVLPNGAIKAEMVPAGFLKITAQAMSLFYRAYPELTYGPVYHPYIDLFQHGAHENEWFGEDYRFSRRWNAIPDGGGIHLLPDLNLTHWLPVVEDGRVVDHKPFHGNFHHFLLRQPGGSECLDQG